MKIEHIAALIAFFGVTTSFAAELSLSASVDRSTVGLGQEFTLTVTVQGEDMGSVPRPELPELADFNLLSQSQSSSTSVQIINGQMKKQSSVNFIYALSAKRMGKLTIGPCTLKYQGQEHQSQPIGIEVVKSSQPAAPPGAQAPPISAPQPGVPLEGNLFIAAAADRKTAFVGEQVNVEYVLYTRLRIGNIEMSQAPSFSGFWAEKLFDASKVDFQQRTVEGKKYNAMLLKKVALFPMAAGQHQAGPMELNIEVVQPPRDFFDFFGSSRAVKVASKQATVTAMPLPDEGRPPEFSGGVGQYALSASIDKAAATGSEPIALTVKVSGTGNVRMIERPELKTVPGLRILEPEVKESVQVSGSLVRGTKTFSYPIMAQADGSYRVPAFRMAFFDPKAKAYYSAEAGPFEFTATGCGQAAPLVEATGLKVLGTDISYIKPDAAGMKPWPAGPPPWTYALYAASLLMMAGSFAVRGHRERMEADRGYARKVRSGAAVRRRLKLAEACLKRDDIKEFYGALSQAVLGYAGDRFNLDTGALTREQLKERLADSGVRPDVIEELMGVAGACETARFSPESGRQAPRELMARAREAMGKL